MKYTIEDVFDVSAAHYWQVFFSQEFNEALWPALNIEWQLLKLERRGEGDALEIDREQRLTPRRELPGFMEKLVKGKLSYVERNAFRARDNFMRTTTTPSFMPEKINTNGVYRLEVLGPQRVKRIWEGTCEVNVALIGGRIEKTLVEEIRESYRKATDFTRKWHAAHPV
jgi:hypothetical protein